jgi:cytochrome b6-f complex iron-sulfur subunit
MSDPNPHPTGSPPPDKPPTGVTPMPAGKTETAVRETPAPAKPPAVPAKPAAPAKPAGKAGVRRFFLIALVATPFACAWSAFVGTMGIWFLGTLRFLVPNVLTEPPSKFKVGFPDGYEDGKVVERFKDQNAWIVRDEGKIYALSTTCTHLGCTPNWLEREQKFKCPCHGSGFYISGINFEGPAPRPLERWALSIGDDGQIVVDKSKKFQQERGEWTNPESFIKV